MTNLASRKTRLCVRTDATFFEQGRRREIIMEDFTPYSVSLRLKGSHRSFEISYESIYGLAVKQQVAREKAEKKAGRK